MSPIRRLRLLLIRTMTLLISVMFRRSLRLLQFVNMVILIVRLLLNGTRRRVISGLQMMIIWQIAVMIWTTR